VVWFGKINAPSCLDDLRLLATLRKQTVVQIFPVCDTLADFNCKVPKRLQPLNGLPWEPERIVAEIMASFELTRRQRQAFISYRRVESQGVARQLYETLQHRGFQVFLDTASVPAGSIFQEVLMGSLADVDLAVFLDTPKAFQSRWTQTEIENAKTIGLGLLQVIWPGHEGSSGGDLAERLKLEQSAFSPPWQSPVNPRSRLTASTLHNVIHQVERVRIRAVAMRRKNLIQTIRNSALKAYGEKPFQFDLISIHSSPTRTESPAKSPRFIRIDITPDGGKLRRVVPVVGFPTAQSLQLVEEIGDSTASGVPTCIAYDPQFVPAELQYHIDWLRRKTPALSILPTGSLKEWLSS